MKRLFLILALSIAAFPHPTKAVTGCDGASNCYVRSGATGAGTGADWTNAFTGFGTGAGQANPVSLTRGVIYYVAGGSYNTSSTTTFNTPNSGTTLITIQAPTVASHGTATGWSNAFKAQALFGPVDFETDNWVFNGVYRGSGTGLPATDWRTGYGFKINNNNGSHAPINGTCGVCIGLFPSTGGNNVTVEFVEIAGSGNTAGTSADRGITDNDGQNPIIQDNFVHDTGNCSLLLDAVGNVQLFFNWLMNNQSTPATHAEGIAFRGPMTVNMAFNYLENEEGTGYIGTPCPSTGCNLGRGVWSFYGNVFLANLNEWHGNTSPQNGLSFAIMQFFGGSGAGNSSSWTKLNFWNNTVYQIGGSSPTNGCELLNGGFVVSTSLTFQDNLIVNCKTSGPPGATGGTTTYDHNSYFEVTTVGDTGTGVQNVASGTPFNAPGTNDFSLAFDTAAWTVLSSPFNVDLLGNTRTTSRGAFQFSGAPSSAAPSPPSGLKITEVQ